MSTEYFGNRSPRPLAEARLLPPGQLLSPRDVDFDFDVVLAAARVSRGVKACERLSLDGVRTSFEFADKVVSQINNVGVNVTVSPTAEDAFFKRRQDQREFRINNPILCVAGAMENFADGGLDQVGDGVHERVFVAYDCIRRG